MPGDSGNPGPTPTAGIRGIGGGESAIAVGRPSARGFSRSREREIPPFPHAVQAIQVNSQENGPPYETFSGRTAGRTPPNP